MKILENFQNYSMSQLIIFFVELIRIMVTAAPENMLRI